MSHPYQHAYPPAPPPARPAPKPKTWGWIVGIIGAFVFGLVIGIAGGGKADTAGTTTTVTAPAGDGTVAEAAPPPQQPAGPATTMGNGTFQVGVDVQPGQYKTPGPDGGLPCYWARRKDDSGSFESIIANGVPQGPSSLTINQGEFIELSGGCDWTKVG